MSLNARRSEVGSRTIFLPESRNSDVRGEESVLQRIFTPDGKVIRVRLSDIRDLQAGTARGEIYRVRNFIFHDLQKLGKEFNRASLSSVMKGSDESRFNAIRGIVDENMGFKSMAPVIWDRLGYAVHVSHIGHKGKSDMAIFRYAIEHGYNTIFTRDLAQDNVHIDLSAIAIKHFQENRSEESRKVRNRFPMIVQFEAANGKKAELRRLLLTHYAAVGQAVINRRTPLVRLSDDRGFENGFEFAF